MAEVTVGGDQRQAAYAGFRILAGYIFGGNIRGERIAMTAPVTLIPAETNIGRATPVIETQDATRWVVRFTMPRAYRPDTLPRPRDARVQVRAVPPTRVAVLRFSGLARRHEVQAKALELAGWIRTKGLRAIGPVSLAQYDPPWTLWFLRRDEVMIPVAA